MCPVERHGVVGVTRTRSSGVEALFPEDDDDGVAGEEVRRPRCVVRADLQRMEAMVREVSCYRPRLTVDAESLSSR
jgi:hypothetical protein